MHSINAIDGWITHQLRHGGLGDKLEQSRIFSEWSVKRPTVSWVRVEDTPDDHPVKKIGLSGWSRNNYRMNDVLSREILLDRAGTDHSEYRIIPGVTRHNDSLSTRAGCSHFVDLWNSAEQLSSRLNNSATDNSGVRSGLCSRQNMSHRLVISLSFCAKREHSFATVKLNTKPTALKRMKMTVVGIHERLFSKINIPGDLFSCTGCKTSFLNSIW